MSSKKKPVVCTISFLPDETQQKFEVRIERQGTDGGFEERNRFAKLADALTWLSASFQEQVEAWNNDRRKFEQLKRTASPRDRVIYFMTAPSQIPQAERIRRRRKAALAARTRQIGEYTFRFIRLIEPTRDKDGNVKEFLPQLRYHNSSSLPLHRYGHGPFCRFRISRDLDQAGFYTLTVADEPVYIDECQNLSERFNSRGYGTISPRNCYEVNRPTARIIARALHPRVNGSNPVYLMCRHIQSRHQKIRSLNRNACLPSCRPRGSQPRWHR